MPCRSCQGTRTVPPLVARTEWPMSVIVMQQFWCQLSIDWGVTDLSDIHLSNCNHRLFTQKKTETRLQLHNMLTWIDPWTSTSGSWNSRRCAGDTSRTPPSFGPWEALWTVGPPSWIWNPSDAQHRQRCGHWGVPCEPRNWMGWPSLNNYDSISWLFCPVAFSISWIK